MPTEDQRSNGVDREQAWLREVRTFILRNGVSTLTVDNLTASDLDHIAWSGNPKHLDAVRAMLARVPGGHVEYLTVRAPDGRPVAKGAIDFAQHEAAGTLSQLATHPGLQSMGIGGLLMAGAEARIAGRGLSTVIIGVEDDHHRARALYERRGFVAVGHDSDAWEVQQPGGTVTTHHAEVTIMRKLLP